MERRRTRRQGRKALGLLLCLATTVLAGCPATKIAEAAGETGTGHHSGSKGSKVAEILGILGAILAEVMTPIPAGTSAKGARGSVVGSPSDDSGGDYASASGSGASATRKPSSSKSPIKRAGTSEAADDPVPEVASEAGSDPKVDPPGKVGTPPEKEVVEGLVNIDTDGTGVEKWDGSA